MFFSECMHAINTKRKYKFFIGGTYIFYAEYISMKATIKTTLFYRPNPMPFIAVFGSTFYNYFEIKISSLTWIIVFSAFLN